MRNGLSKDLIARVLGGAPKYTLEELEAKFLKVVSENGMIGLKGHRSVGGLRASIYNAMPIEGVQKLVDLMETFRKNN